MQIVREVRRNIASAAPAYGSSGRGTCTRGTKVAMRQFITLQVALFSSNGILQRRASVCILSVYR